MNTGQQAPYLIVYSGEVVKLYLTLTRQRLILLDYHSGPRSILCLYTLAVLPTVCAIFLIAKAFERFR